ncbi:MAG: hypothetical protein V1844_09295 [Pseudomonadota bacterium]
MPIETVRLQRAIKKWTGWMATILIVAAWGFPVSAALAGTNLKASQVTWNAGSAEVKIKGSGAGNNQLVLFLNADNKQQIGSIRSGNDGAFEYVKKDLNPAPCKYLIQGYDGLKITTGYTSNPPAECSTTVPATLNGITVSGPTTVNENSSADYIATAIYSDGSSKIVTASTTWTENSSYASINSSGHLVTTAVTANQLLLVRGAFSGKSASISVTIRDIPTPTPISGSYQVFGFNDLGMHCYDPDFSVFSILPLFNVLHAQVVQKGSTPKIVGSTVNVTYKAMADATGSINTTSIGKTNFWDYVLKLYGGNPPLDEGLLGAKMPGSVNQPQPFSWAGGTGATNWFGAAGVPITAMDDNLKINSFPLMNVQAKDPANAVVLSSLPVVVPVSNEMACNVCHNTGNVAALGSGWSTSTKPAIQFRENILLLHDKNHGTSLSKNQPVLCASCHYSPALDLAHTGPVGSQVMNKTMSQAVHGYHASRTNTLPPSGNACYYCHPGEKTQCARGAMDKAGLSCLDCHGTMTAVAQTNRRAWADLPMCQSCHTGDAMNNLGGQIIRRSTYTDSPDTATFIVAGNKRFAEQTGTLFRNSVGHNGVACESCHGSPHAEWPSREANDNLAASTIQGHDGMISECTACHGSGLALTANGGPHGIHNVNSQAWINGHHNYASKQACGTCHGATGNGTVISKAAVNRTFSVEGRTVSIPKGMQISCSLCHENKI